MIKFDTKKQKYKISIGNKYSEKKLKILCLALFNVYNNNWRNNKCDNDEINFNLNILDVKHGLSQK